MILYRARSAPDKRPRMRRSLLNCLMLFMLVLGLTVSGAHAAEFTVCLDGPASMEMGHANGDSGVVMTSGTTTGRADGRGMTMKPPTTVHADDDRGTKRTPSKGTAGNRTFRPGPTSPAAGRRGAGRRGWTWPG